MLLTQVIETLETERRTCEQNLERIKLALQALGAEGSAAAGDVGGGAGAHCRSPARPLGRVAQGAAQGAGAARGLRFF